MTDMLTHEQVPIFIMKELGPSKNIEALMITRVIIKGMGRNKKISTKEVNKIIRENIAKYSRLIKRQENKILELVKDDPKLNNKEKSNIITKARDRYRAEQVNSDSFLDIKYIRNIVSEEREKVIKKRKTFVQKIRHAFRRGRGL